MKLRNHNYKNSLEQIIKEEIQKQLFLQEIFDSLPFKTKFIFLILRMKLNVILLKITKEMIFKLHSMN